MRDREDSERLALLGRYFKSILLFAIAAVMVWRAVSYTDPKGYIESNGIIAMLPAVMCSLFSVSCMLTGLAMAFRDDSAEVAG